MELKDLDRVQLYRLYRRLYARLPDGGCFGWDWITLRGAYPSLYYTLRSVAYAHDHAEVNCHGSITRLESLQRCRQVHRVR